MKNLSERRAAIVDALNKAIDIFTSHDEKTFDDVMTNGIRPIAEAVGLDRVVFYRRLDIDGQKRFGQIYRWDKAEGGLIFLDEDLKVLPDIPVLARWISILSNGENVKIRKSGMTEDESAFLDMFGIKSILIVPVFTHGEFWGGVALQDHTRDEYFDEGCIDLLYSAARLCANAIIRAETSKNANDVLTTLIRREKMTETLNEAAIIFLSQSSASFENTMTAGVTLIADMLNLDRMSIWRNFMKSDGLHVSQIYRWDRKSGGTTEPTPGLEDVTYARLAPRWEGLLSSGEVINSPVHLLPEAAMLKAFGVVSVFIMPVFINGVFWGFMLFEDRHNERYFENDNVDMMRSAGLLCVNIVIRSEMEQNVANANEQTRAIAEASPIPYVLFDEDMHAIDCNDATMRMFACTDKQYLLENYWERFVPESQSGGIESFEEAKTKMDEAFTSGQTVYEWVHKSLEGELIPVENTLTQVTHKGKKFLISFKYDLRGSKKMMENIREQSELLKIRLEQQELISEISRGFIASGDSETHAKEAIAKLGHYHNVSLVFIFSIDYKQNTTRPAHHWSADGLPPRMVKFDLLGLIRSNFPEWLPDCSTVPVISCEDIAASPVEAFHELLTADVCAFICAPLYVEGHLWGALAVEQCHTPRHWTYNEKSFVAMTASTIAGVIMRDIYNTMLKDALQKATVASRAKGEFLSNMSHEMRTPLNAIIGMTAIGKNAANMERKNYALTKIEDASTHLLGVINDVLDMSKIEANKLELSYIEFDFERMLQKVVSVINFRVEEKKQKLLVNVDPAIPKILIGDDQRLAQVVTNLLANAVKFTPENGSITLDARFLGEEDSKGTEGSKGTNGSSCIIQVSVTDTGIGISPEQQAKLFQSFQQAESSTVRKYGGTGLGLSISKNIVEMMGGKIWVESKPAKGSTFAFTIQAKRGEEKNQDIHDMSKEQQADEITEGVFAGHCILLAEDVEINREIVLTLLEPTLLEIDCAENGTQAVNMFIEKPDKYRMIFMDVQMPEMDGYDATRRIRSFEAERKGKTGKQVPIIAMTANVFKEDIDRCLEAGMNDHVGKPLDFGIVLEKLRTYLQKSGNIN